MYLPIPPQPDVFAAWREAVRLVDEAGGHAANNVIVDVADPTARGRLTDPAVKLVDDFLVGHKAKAIETVANTIFPEALYNRHKSPLFFSRFTDNVLPRVGKTGCWSGYYFERMIRYPLPGGGTTNQLDDIIERIRNPDVTALNKFELSVFDPTRDVDKSNYGGQCLSFASLKLIGPSAKREIAMTALYRNHYYVEKLLGNLIGLGRLMSFLAKETGLAIGPLTIVSTHAQIDLPGGARRSDLKKLLEACDQVSANSGKTC